MAILLSPPWWLSPCGDAAARVCFGRKEYVNGAEESNGEEGHEEGPGEKDLPQAVRKEELKQPRDNCSSSARRVGQDREASDGPPISARRVGQDREASDGPPIQCWA